MKGLEKANLPPSLSVPKGDAVTLTWQPGWIPAGMSLVSQNRRTLPGLNKNMESKLYSDGLFSFAINVTPADKTSTTQTLRTGRRTVQTVVRNNNEIAVIGELPPSTAKRIADSIDLGSQNDERMGHRGGMAGWHRHAAHRSKTSCNSCQARKGCGSHMLNKLGPKNAHVMQIASSKQAAAAGAADRTRYQREQPAGFSAAGLHDAAVWPVPGFRAVSGAVQQRSGRRLRCAAGRYRGFIVAKGVSMKFGDREAFQPVILNIALPPDALRVESEA